MKHPVGQSGNGVAITVDLIHSMAAKRISQQPHLLGYANEILQKQALKKSTVLIEHDMGYDVGYAPIVTTSDEDIVFYGQVLREAIYSRFVKKTKAEHTSFITISLERDEDGSYQINDIWIGQFYPPRPGDENETAESLAYWQSHAFVFDNQSLQPRTVTKTSPY